MTAQAPGAPARKLAVGDSVFAGERLRTGAQTVLLIDFTDKSRLTLGPNTEFEVERFAEEAFHSRVFKGAFRFVSGLLARQQPRNFLVNVPVATIGIRGTHFEGEVAERFSAYLAAHPVR